MLDHVTRKGQGTMRKGMTLTRLFLLSLLTTLSQAASAQTYQVIHAFTWALQPYGALAQDASGNLFGTTSANLPNGYGVVYELSPHSDGSWSTTTLHAFNKTDGAYPFAGLILDASGNLYGTTSGGGISCSDALPNGCGVVFKLSINSKGAWEYSVLHKFTGSDGELPFGELVLDKSGSLYGTTWLGGAVGAGTLFKLSKDIRETWILRTIHSFGESRGDGGGPRGSIAFDSSGNLYGTTQGGSGGVFRLAPEEDGNWKESMIYIFSGVPQATGAQPVGGIVVDSAGNLYGTASTGFIGSCLAEGEGCGFVFKLSENVDGTWRECILHKFTGESDGGGPLAGVSLDRAGNVYGTTADGGDLRACGGRGCGVVYKLVLERDGTWSETVLHSFLGYGQASRAPIILDPKGAMYGTTELGVIDSHGFDHGLVFEMTP